MPATEADVFDPIGSSLIKSDDVAQHHTGRRMSNNGEASWFLDE